MVNVNKLRGKIVEKGVSAEHLAIKIGMDRSTFYRKIAKNGESFTIGEADIITRELGLTLYEANDIFFAQFVAQNATNENNLENHA